MVIEKEHQFHGPVPNDAVAVDKLLVTVSQKRPHVGETVIEMEEYGSAWAENFRIA